MIQDIAPHRLDNAFAVKEAKPEHFFFTFHKGNAAAAFAATRIL